MTDWITVEKPGWWIDNSIEFDNRITGRCCTIKATNVRRYVDRSVDNKIGKLISRAISEILGASQKECHLRNKM